MDNSRKNPKSNQAGVEDMEFPVLEIPAECRNSKG